MNEWDQRIRQHRVFGEMQSLGPAIDTASSTEALSPEAVAGLERLKSILAFSGKRIAAADPLVSTTAPLDEIASAFVAVREEIERFNSDHNITRIATANTSADRVLAVINQVPGTYSPEELGALISVAVSSREMISNSLSVSAKTLSEFSANAELLKSRLGDLAGSIQTEQQKLAQIATEYQAQFSTSQEKRNQEFSETLRKSQQDLTKLVTDYQAQFSTGQDTRSKEFTEAQGIRQTRFSEIVADYSKRLSDQDSEFTIQRSELVRTFDTNLGKLIVDYEEQADVILKRVRDKEEHVEKLVGVIGNLGVTSGYLRTANRAQKTMWFWQGLTVVALVSLSWLAFHTLPLLEDASGHFNWGGFAGRVLLLGSLGVIAAYAGNQADKLFIEEKRNRKLALELEAIGPYLAPLPTDEQNKFRIQIGDRSFGREDDTGHKPRRKSPVSVVDLLKSKEGQEVFELLMELAKKAKDKV